MSATPESIMGWAEASGYEVTEDVAQLLADYFAAREPAPKYQPGDVAIATVRGDGAVTGVLVMRTEPVGTDDTEQWVSSVPVDGMFWHELDDVTVTSRAVVVTEDEADVFAVQLDDKWGCDEEHPEGTCTACDLIAGVAGDFREWFAAKLGGGSNG